MPAKITALSGLLAISIMAAVAIPGHGDNCNPMPSTDTGFAIERNKLSHMTLIQVPCRFTVNSIESVFFTQDDGGLHPLFFASALIDYRHDGNGHID